MCFAHRGGARLRPENTLLAFQGAREVGCEFVETDLHLTRDGELVLIHDETVDRTTDGTGRVADLEFEELRRLDAGYRFTRGQGIHPFRGRGLVIPTLAEALAVHPELRFNIDMKPRDPAIVGRLVDFIEIEGVHERLLVASEHDTLLKRFRDATSGRVATAAGRGEATRFWLATQVGLSHQLNLHFDALQVPPSLRLLNVVDERLVERAHAAGVQVHVFTINSFAEMRRLLNVGVNGIITDRPDRLVPIARHHTELERDSQDPIPSSRW
jgi:glycerophosphoryl diester phosphodiesterase